MNEKVKKERGKSPRVIRVSLTTAKARKIIHFVKSGECSKNPVLRDIYLRGMRDMLGGDLGWSFRRAILTGDIHAVARFCRDGWRVVGDREAFEPHIDKKKVKRELLRIVHEAFAERED